MLLLFFFSLFPFSFSSRLLILLLSKWAQAACQNRAIFGSPTIRQKKTNHEAISIFKASEIVQLCFVGQFFFLQRAVSPVIFFIREEKEKQEKIV